MAEHSRPAATADSTDLVVRARTSRTAFGELCTLYYPRIYRYCLRRLFHREGAEDVTAEAFLSIARSIATFPGTTHDDFLRWAHTIATNEANAYLRKHKRRATLLVEAAERGAVHVAGAASRAATPAKTLDELDWPAVYEALQRLSPRDQSLIVLRFFECLSHRDVARVLNMQPGAVRTAESRALQKMRLDLGVES
jgi:RNA polymerase sigma-70 factor (ECF subfamily)